jgi:hypothetical protein
MAWQHIPGESALHDTHSPSMAPRRGLRRQRSSLGEGIVHLLKIAADTFILRKCESVRAAKIQGFVKAQNKYSPLFTAQTYNFWHEVDNAL